MRKSKRNKNKKTSGTNLKVSPLKRYKKQVKRMKNRIAEYKRFPEFDNKPEFQEQVKKYQTRLEGAEEHLRNWDKEQEQKKADAFKAAALAKKAG